MTFLPETSDHKLPDTIEEGEELGKGDTLYKCGRGRRTDKYNVKGENYNGLGVDA